MRVLITALLLTLCVGSALAVEPEEMLDDPVLEERAREISKELRCLVCQNQSIDDSNAGLARDLRVLVRERLTAGDSNEEAVRYIVDRYGDFVLLRPPVRPGTYALWFGPAVLIVVAGLGLVLFFRRRRTRAVETAPPPLTQDERTRLKALLDEESEA
jgi:cytochrome c-type biogenesis protein CcmH